MARFFFGAAPDVAGAPSIERSSLFRCSICSLIEAARFSCSGVRSSRFMMAVHTFKAALNQALAHDSQVQKISQRSWCFGLLFAVNHPNCGAIPSICRRIMRAKRLRGRQKDPNRLLRASSLTKTVMYESVCKFGRERGRGKKWLSDLAEGRRYRAG